MGLEISLSGDLHQYSPVETSVRSEMIEIREETEKGVVLLPVNTSVLGFQFPEGNVIAQLTSGREEALWTP